MIRFSIILAADGKRLLSQEYKTNFNICIFSIIIFLLIESVKYVFSNLF